MSLSVRTIIAVDTGLQLMLYKHYVRLQTVVCLGILFSFPTLLGVFISVLFGLY
jgi:hypothetical protein